MLKLRINTEYIKNLMYKTFFKYFNIKSEFGKNVLTLFSGSTISQILPFLVAPILTRMYSPEQFGEFGIFMSVVGIFSIISTFQYESAIMLPKEDEDAFNILALTTFIALFVSFISWIITKKFGNNIATLLDTNSIKEWTFIIGVFVFLTGLFNSLNIWASRKKQYKRLAVRQIAQSTVGASTKVLLGWLKYLNSGLILGTVAGQLTSTGVLTAMTIKDSKHLFKTITIKRIKKNAIIYQDFPKYTMWQGFLDMINSSGVVFVLSSYYGITIVGFYTFTLSMLRKPLKLIGNSISQVFYQKASNLYNQNKDIWGITKKLIIRLFIVSLFLFIPIIIFGPYIFKIVFGEKWIVSGRYSQLIVPWMFSRFICSPLSNIANILGKQKILLVFVSIYNFMFPGFFLIFVNLNFSFEKSLFILSLFALLYYIIILLWIRQISKSIIYENKETY